MILVAQETRQTIVAPLHHVLRNAGEIETRKSAMSDTITPCVLRDAQRAPYPTLTPVANPLSEIVPGTFSAQASLQEYVQLTTSPLMEEPT
jgi:hypothetical protein